MNSSILLDGTETSSTEILQSMQIEQSLAELISKYTSKLTSCILDLTSTVTVCNASLQAKIVPTVVRYRGDAHAPMSKLMLASNVTYVHTLNFDDVIPTCKQLALVAVDNDSIEAYKGMQDELDYLLTPLIVLGETELDKHFKKIYSMSEELKAVDGTVIGRFYHEV